MRKTKYIIGFALILLGVGLVMATLLPGSMQYYVTVSELKAQERDLMGKEIKVAGKVQPGSIQREPGSLDVGFTLETAPHIVHVSYRGALPDTFRDEAEVVATGKLSRSGQLEAHHILAKCASRYEEKLTPGYEAP